MYVSVYVFVFVSVYVYVLVFVSVYFAFGTPSSRNLGMRGRVTIRKAQGCNSGQVELRRESERAQTTNEARVQVQGEAGRKEEVGSNNKWATMQARMDGWKSWEEGEESGVVRLAPSPLARSHENLEHLHIMGRESAGLKLAAHLAKALLLPQVPHLKRLVGVQSKLRGWWQQLGRGRVVC